ncbi:MAG: hypothetical protein JO353_02130 [Phycisphaerae bacterium]|nr:hypothetical protein [Phycisphaerae bacterium]
MAALQPILLFIKKNIASLICALVAIGAMVFLFWTVAGWNAELQTTVDQRKSTYNDLSALLTKQRTLPLLDPFSTQPPPLNQFPTQPVYERAKTVTQAVSEESKAMLDTAMKMVTHSLLVPNSLPNGGPREGTFFREKYQQIMSFPNLTDPEKDKVTLPYTLLHAGMPPSEQTIKDAQDALKVKITNERTHYTNGQPDNAAEVADTVTEQQLALPAEMQSDVALKSKMYIAPDAIHINPNLVGAALPNTLNMFNAQSTLWLSQDVFTAMAAANADSDKGIPTSRIKHLIKMDYSDAPFVPPGANFDPNAAPPPAADASKPTNNPLVSPTGHVSNGMYDVVPFSLKIVVDAASIPDILAILAKDRFITVLKMDVLTVDSGEALLGGYIYGSKPVVLLNLSCEELFFRDDTTRFMPEALKRVLGIAPPQSAPPPQPGA